MSAKLKQRKETPAEVNERRAAAYERGWVDSLRGYFGLVTEPVNDKFDYGRGWDDCADYRWADPKNNGVAPDLNYRPAASPPVLQEKR